MGDLTDVEASYNTLYGTISVKWKVDNGQFVMDIEFRSIVKRKYICLGKPDIPPLKAGNIISVRIGAALAIIWKVRKNG